MNTKRRTIFTRLLAAAAIVLVLSAAGVQTARALEIDETGIVPAGTVIDDDLLLGNDVVRFDGTVTGSLMAAGNDVEVGGTVEGDLFACGATVKITGTVQGNIFACGGHVEMTGTTEDSFFFGGNSLTIAPEAVIARNLYTGGFSVSLESGAKVGRDLLDGSYQLIVAGNVTRDVKAAVGALDVSGTVGRDIVVDVSQQDNNDEQSAQMMNAMPFFQINRFIAPGLHIEKGAQIGGKLEYTSNVDESAGILSNPAGGVVYHYQAPQTNQFHFNTVPAMKIDLVATIFSYFFNVIRDFLTLTVLGALVVWLIPAWLNKSVAMLKAKPLPSLGWGFIVSVLGVVAIIVAIVAILLLGIAVGAITLFGLMGLVFGLGFSALGLGGTIFMALASYGSKLVIALLIGDGIFHLIKKDYSASAFWPLLLGILLLAVVIAVPILGTLVDLFVLLFGFGAIFLVIRDEWMTRKPPAA